MAWFLGYFFGEIGYHRSSATTTEEDILYTEPRPQSFLRSYFVWSLANRPPWIGPDIILFASYDLILTFLCSAAPSGSVADPLRTEGVQLYEGSGAHLRVYTAVGATFGWLFLVANVALYAKYRLRPIWAATEASIMLLVNLPLLIISFIHRGDLQKPSLDSAAIFVAFEVGYFLFALYSIYVHFQYSRLLKSVITQVQPVRQTAYIPKNPDDIEVHTFRPNGRK